LLSRVSRFVASPSIDDLLAAMQAVTELQRAVYTMQDSIAKHTKVLDHLIDGFNLMDQRLKKLESRK
jgi:uncharacterized coiled-coil protein SlyX